MDGTGLAVALLVEDGFDDRELTDISAGLLAAALEVVTVGPIAGRAYAGRQGVARVTAELAPRAAAERGFAAVVIPGGYAPDRMRLRHGLIDLVRETLRAGRPVGSVGHGAQVLISADVIRGRTLTCWPSIAVDVKNAGGLYVDRPVAEDGALITARKADDIPAFIATIVRAIGRAG